MTAPRTFRQTDVTRAIKAVEAAGREVRRVDIGRDGTIRLVMVEQTDDNPATPRDDILL
jgi:hypothetical protein